MSTTEVKEFRASATLSKDKLNENLVEEVEKIKCDCEHQSRIYEYQSSSAKWKAIIIALVILLFIIIWLAYMIGLAFGVYYCHVFGIGGCYSNFFWSKDCYVAY